MRTQHVSIRKIADYLNNPEEMGGFWLPSIQRSFVWSEGQIERLFDSVMRDYPISTMLVWKTKSPIRHRKFIDNYREDLKLSSLFVPENEDRKILVLDGQQRLQSFYIGLKGSFSKKELYLNVLSGDLSAPEDIRYEFKFMKAEKVAFPWLRVKDLVYSSERSNRMAARIIQEGPGELSDREKDRIDDNIAQLAKAFKEDDNIVYQELDSVDAPDTYKEDDVVEIFIRANSGGTILGKSDLLFSLLTVSWDNANEEIEDLLDVLNRDGFRYDRDFVLKACLTILGKGAAYNVTKFRDPRTRYQIVTEWGGISAAIRDVKDFLSGKTFLRCDKALPSYLTLIPLIYFRYHHHTKWATVSRLDEYVLRTSLAGAFSGNPDRLIDLCVKKIDELSALDVDEIFGVIRSDGRSLEITKENILSENYRSKNIHLLLNLWYKDFNYHPGFENNLPQIDHIFPQSILKTVKALNPSTGRKDLLEYKQPERDQIANCMLLTAAENGAGGKRDTPPDVWFEGKDDKYLDQHQIPRDKNLWKLEKFREFVEQRKKLIEIKFKDIILAPVVSDQRLQINVTEGTHT